MGKRREECALYRKLLKKDNHRVKTLLGRLGKSTKVTIHRNRL